MCIITHPNVPPLLPLHDVVQGALLVVPVICAELSDKYNDVWLTDILRIIYFVLR